MERPIPIHRALERFSFESLPTIAAFLLLAGIWHRAEYERSPIVPRDDLQATGFGEWTRETTGRGKHRMRSFADDEDAGFSVPFDLDGFDYTAESRRAEERDERAAHDKLATAIHRALSTGHKKDTADALLAALVAPWPILRTCARISALDFFSWTERDMQWLRFSIMRDLHLLINRPAIESQIDLHLSLAEVLVAKLGLTDYPWPWWSPSRISPRYSSKPKSPVGLMLIHGTVFWGKPTWSVPGSGGLFRYIQTHLRPDVYSHDDHFAWEGSYTFGGYGREIAARNLRRWMQDRQLSGIDAVSHSHGGNVLIEATTKGCRFGDILLLSCPVRKEYKLDCKAVRSARSVRIRFDLVLLADRARQRFPKGSGISETVLPVWYMSHSVTTEPSTWQRHGIRI